MELFRRYIMFIQLLFMSWIGKLGVIVTSTAFVSFFVLEGLTIIGVFRNTYTGIVTYFIIPIIFVFGLILLPIAWSVQKKQTGKTLHNVFIDKMRSSGVDVQDFWEKVIPIVLVLTVVNVAFLVAAGSSAMHYMDQAEFCGTACHSVMGPEWAVYSVSPHSKVPCVDCHIGEGVKALAAAKVNGAWQLVSTMFKLYDRPIGTPIHNLRPARETCGKCHWPEKHYGSKLVKHKRYKEDEKNTPQYTALNLKVDASNGVGTGIHWHVSEDNEVRDTSIDDIRETMIWVEVKQKNGEYHRYSNDHFVDSTFTELEPRIMDCVDCHNRATHIYERPDAAMDLVMANGIVDTNLPFIKKEGLAALLGDYPDKQAGINGIEERLRSFYEIEYPDLESPTLDSTISAIQTIYKRNIHPTMNVGWNTYPNHLGHKVEFGCFSCHNFMQHEQSDGCFRCHNRHLVDDKGNSISDECTLCHSILSIRSENPLQYILDNDFNSFEEHKNKYFRDEYLKTF